MNYRLLTVIITALLCATFLSAQNVPNGSFENWTDDEPDDWGTSNKPGSNVITKSTDAFSDSFAARGQTIEVNNDNLAVNLEADGPPEAFGLGFPISGQFTNMTFRYKFDNGSNDEFLALVSIRNTDSISIGLGSITIVDNSTDWSLATVLIDYTGEGTPGFAAIQFVLQDKTGGDPPSTDAFFIIDDVTLSILTDVNDDNPIVPHKHHLYNNYPNPFNPTTTIAYELDKASDVAITIYNLSGQRVKTVLSQFQGVGRHEAVWDGRNDAGVSLPSGVYLYSLRAGGNTLTKKMVLMK